jgi:hypothetical protein
MRNRQPAKWIMACALVAVGAGLLTFGLLNRDRLSVTETLLGCGIALILVGAAFPWLASFNVKILGVNVMVALIPPNRSADDRQLLPDELAPLRRADPYTSYREDFQKVILGPSVDYVTISLGAGQSWLSSRLYLFINALAEVRGIEAVVFTSRERGSKDVFIGVCSAGILNWRLAWAFPWLPIALAEAWEEIRGMGPGDNTRRRMESIDAAKLYPKYVGRLLSPGTDPYLPAKPLPDPADRDNWADVGNDQWEHARWVTQAFIEDVLKDDMTTDCVVGPPEDAQTIRAALAKPSRQYIAVLNDRHEFSSLVDRSRLTRPQLAEESAKASK